MMTKEEFMDRPEDIKLPKQWMEMRRRQREREWPSYWQNSQMANCATGSYYGAQNTILGALSGDIAGRGGF